MAYKNIHLNAGKSANPALDAIVKTSRLRQNAQGYWQIVYSEPAEDGRWRSKTFSTRTQDFATAQQALTDWLTAAQNKRHVQNEGVYTVGKLIDRYLEAKATALGKTTVFTYKTAQQFLGHLKPQEIDQNTVRLYVSVRENRRDGGLAKSATVRREIAALLTAVRFGIRNKWLSADALPMLDLPAQSLPRGQFMRVAEEERFWTEAQKQGGQVALFVAIGLDTAARKSAILDLTWDRIDLANKLIDYRDPQVRVSKKRRVVVPISTRLMPVLEAACQASGGHGRLFNSRLRHAYEGFIKRIGMAWVTAHVMRHTWASLAAIDGVPMFLIAKMLGDTLLTVETTYAHLHPTHLHDAASRRWTTQTYK